MLYPDFYIVGAPKCGTTALANYLAQSGNIHFHKKEVHYFGENLNFNRPRISYKSYTDQTFKLSSKGLVGEASVFYLFSATAAEEIYKANPHAKIMICLRHPVEFMQ